MAATTFWIGGIQGASDISPGAGFYNAVLILGARDTVDGGTAAATNVAGPTAGIPFKTLIGGNTYQWYSAPLSAVTISGTITFNIWLGETSMAINAGGEVRVFRCDNAGVEISTIIASERGVEMAVLPPLTANNWTGTPTSTTLADGDRLKAVLYINDAGGTMTLGGECDVHTGATSAGAEGDSFVTFTETITLQGGAASDTPYPFTGGGYYGFQSLVEHVKRRYWRLGWQPHPSGVLIPA